MDAEPLLQPQTYEFDTHLLSEAPELLSARALSGLDPQPTVICLHSGILYDPRWPEIASELDESGIPVCVLSDVSYGVRPDNSSLREGWGFVSVPPYQRHEVLFRKLLDWAQSSKLERRPFLAAHRRRLKTER